LRNILAILDPVFHQKSSDMGDQPHLLEEENSSKIEIKD